MHGLPYPDSVSLVRPPNITMPKTLAALASSQYATLLSLVSGKELGRALLFALSAAAAAATASDALFSTGSVLCHRTVWAMDGLPHGAARGKAENAGRAGAFGHGLLAKKRRARRGAAVLS
jgi:hypothetical protein